MSNALNLVIGTIATVVSLGAGAAACNVWTWPYQLAAATKIERRWGRSLARVYFGILAVVLGFAAVCIYGGFRPRFAIPAQHRPADTYNG